MRLTMNVNKNNGCIIQYGFIDIFVCGQNEYGLDSGAVLELKVIPLEGLYRGKVGKWIENIDYRSLVEIDDELKTDSEENLLRRNYYYWSKQRKQYQLMNVQKCLDLGIEQINKYIKTVKKGSKGVYDERVKIEEGHSILGGYVLISRI